MSKRKIIKILMLSPYYFSLPLRLRCKEVERLCAKQDSPSNDQRPSTASDSPA